MFSLNIYRVIFAVLLGFAVFPDSLFAQGSLLVNPKRVVFDGTNRTMELNLANTGKDTSRYNVSFLQYRMKLDGGFEEIKTPDTGQNFADKYLRVFPRTVVLGPNESQVVKLQVVNPALPAGEYRSHLYFRAVPDEKPLGESSRQDSIKNISVRLVPIFGISIPVIIRSGESTTRVNLTDLSINFPKEGPPQLLVKFIRSGNMSVFGDLMVNYISPAGKSTKIGMVKGLSVYTPNPIRHFTLNLDPKGADLHQGKLQVTYSTPPDAKSVLMAQAELLLH